MTKDQVAQAWRTALDPKGEWIPSVLAAADRRLTEVRRHVPDAGGLVIASNQTPARAYAAHPARADRRGPDGRALRRPGRERSASRSSRASDARWMVAVRMVSEGVDVPRLCVGVYATSTSTPLFFAQAVGRFVRARRRGETASVFLPSVPVVLDHAARLEEQRDHALDRSPTADEVEASMWAEEQGLLDEANREPRRRRASTRAPSRRSSPTPTSTTCSSTSSSGACTRRSARRTRRSTSGCPGLLEPDQVAALLHERQSRAGEEGAAEGGDGARCPSPPHRALAAQRKELNKLVSAYARQKGLPHANVHMDLRRACGGPDLAAASSRAGGRADREDPALARRPALTVSSRIASSPILHVVSLPCGVHGLPAPRDHGIDRTHMKDEMTHRPDPRLPRITPPPAASCSPWPPSAAQASRPSPRRARPPPPAAAPAPTARSSGSPCSARPTCTATSTTGTTSRTPSTPTAGQRHRRGQGRHPHQGGPGRGRRRAHHHPRRRRHHPGHAAGVLLRQDRPHHRRLHAPDGRGDEPRRLRRRRPRQPRVQLRPRPAARLRGAVQLPAARRPTRSTGTPARRSSRPTSSRRSRCPARSRSRSASSGSSRPAWRSGTRPTSRAR